MSNDSSNERPFDPSAEPIAEPANEPAVETVSERAGETSSASFSKPVSDSEESGFSLGRVLLLVVPVALIAAGVLAYVRYADSGNLPTRSAKDLVPTNVRVMFRDQPLKNATITTRTSDGSPGAIGKTDNEGMLEVMTDVGGGVIADGVLPMKHKITVTASLPGMGGADPGPSYTPDLYRDPSTTLVEVDFSKPNKEVIDVVLVDDETSMSVEDMAAHMVRAEEARARAAAGPPPTNRPPGVGGTPRPTVDRPESETPESETPATETPATETPATETPATETPATETPATETPATETPATETPAGGGN